MKRTLGLIAVAGTLVLGGYHEAALHHIGAPDWYGGQYAAQCTARGGVLKTWWVPAPGCNPNMVEDCYEGWQEMGGCSGLLKITAGSAG